MILEIIHIKSSVSFQLNFEEGFVELGRGAFVFQRPNYSNIMGLNTIKLLCLTGLIWSLVGYIKLTVGFSACLITPKLS